MTISNLPPAPTISSPTTFDALADEFIGALPVFVTEANALAVEVNGYQATASAAASDAAAQVGLATTQAGIATTAAGTATTQAGIATAAAAAAAASYDSFDDRYLGPKASDPSLDNDGAALLTGALYFNTASNNMKIYNSISWQIAAGVVSPDFTIVRETFTATASQTVFTLATNYITGTNAIMVYVNGSRQFPSDYTETDSTHITFAIGLTAGDEVLVEIGVTAAGTNNAAGNITYTPAGNIVATNVQAAITELDTEKQAVLPIASQAEMETGTEAALRTMSPLRVAQAVAALAAPALSGSTATSGNVTLTSSSTAVQSVTPTTWGQSVILPDATTYASEGVKFHISNTGEYDLWVKNSSGSSIRVIDPTSSIVVSLSDNSTSAGIWNFVGGGIYGTEVNSTFTLASAISSSGNPGFTKFIQLDTTRALLLIHEAVSVYSIIYDESTGSFGTATLIRTGNFSVETSVTACKTATDQVLVISCPDGSTAMQSVVLSITGTAITVGTPVSTTHGSTFYTNSSIIQVGTSWVIGYTKLGPTAGLRAITISGTTPTVGAELVLNGTGVTPYLYNISSGVILCINALYNGLIYATPVTVSGSTLTKGTEVYLDSTNTQSFQMRYLSTGRIAIITVNNTTILGGIITVTGTTVTISTVVLFSATPTFTSLSAITVNSQVIVGWSVDASEIKYINVLTDNAGVAVSGTHVTAMAVHSTPSTVVALGVMQGKALIAFVSTGEQMIVSVSISGNNAIIDKVQKIPTDLAYSSYIMKTPYITTSENDNRFFLSTVNRIYMVAANGPTALQAMEIFNGNFSYRIQERVPLTAVSYSAKGSSNAERWESVTHFNSTKLNIIKRRLL